MKKKMMSAIIVAIFLFVLGVGTTRTEVSNVTVIKDTISTERMTVRLTNTSYEHGWFTGTVVFEDDFFKEYANSRQDIDVIMGYFSDYYTLTYMALGMSELLPTPGGGCVLNEVGEEYYYEKFKMHVELENEKLDVKIFVYGVEEPFEVILSD